MDDYAPGYTEHGMARVAAEEEEEGKSIMRWASGGSTSHGLNPAAAA